MPYTKDLAYIAGLIDGEGYIGLRKSKERRRTKPSVCFTPCVVLNMVERGGIDVVQRLFNGHLYYCDKKKGNARNTWNWQVNSFKDVTAVLTAIQPYLQIKQRQAEIVLEFIKLRQSKPRTNAAGGNYTEEEWNLWMTVKELNKTGKD